MDVIHPRNVAEAPTSEDLHTALRGALARLSGQCLNSCGFGGSSSRLGNKYRDRGMLGFDWQVAIPA